MLKPLSDWIVVAPLENSERSKGGIYIPDNARERQREGRVIAVGPGHFSEHLGRIIPMQVKVGDHILFSWGANETTTEGVSYRCIREKDIIATVEKGG